MRTKLLSMIAAVSAFTLLVCTMTTRDTITLDGEWLFKADSLNRGQAEQWFLPGTDRSAWERHTLPGFWDRYSDYATYDGAGWYARTFSVKETTQAMSMYFGGVDDDADVWINGIPVGSHAGYSDPFAFDVTRALRKGANEIVVRVDDRSGPGGIYKPITLTPSDRVAELFRSPYALKEARPSADWVRNAVIYEVYVRSFSQEGTFKALEARLGELKDLGVTVVWLMPIHPTGELNRKGTLGSPYSVRDYYGINPEFGTLQDFQSLVAAVHRNGMKIIIDLVANHTSWDSKLLMEHPEWFTRNAEGAIVAPNADWTDVAALNYDGHELRKEMIRMMRYWVEEIGIDGYRCDVAERVPTDFWVTARRELDRIKPVMMLSEGTLPEHHLAAFDLTYSWNVYDVLGRIIDGSTSPRVLDELLKTEANQFPRGSLRMRFNTNHDKNAWDAPAVEKFSPAGAKATAVLAFTLPGVPLIYNGEEVGNSKRLGLFEKVGIDWKGGTEFRAFYTRLAHLRLMHQALRSGTHRPLSLTKDAKVYAFARVASGDSVIVVINLSREAATVTIPLPEELRRNWNDAFGSRFVRNAGDAITADLPAFGFALLEPR